MIKVNLETGVDITKQKQIELTLQEYEEQFRVTFEQTAVGLAHVDLDGHFLRINQKLCEIVGYTHDELMGKTLQEITHADDLEVDLGWSQQIFKAELRTYSVEKRYVHKYGNIVWVNLTVSLVLNKNKTPKYSVLVVENIHDRRQARESLQRFNQRVWGLHAIDRAILAEKSPLEIARAALSNLRPLVTCQQAMVILFNSNTAQAEIIAGSSEGELIFPEATLLPLGDCLNSNELHINKFRYIPDLLISESSSTAKFLLEKGIRSVLAIPLFVEGMAIGELKLVDSNVAAFNSEHISIACEVVDHLAIAIQNARLFEQVRSDHDRLQILSGRLLEAQETERRYIAHELHDEIGQALTAVKINLQLLQRAIPPNQNKHSIEDSIAIVDGALQQVRNLSLDLRPSLLDDLGLLAALRWYVDRQTQRTNTQIDLIYGCTELTLPPKLETACFRIVQESLTNIARHACAQCVLVKLESAQNGVKLYIRDDGSGFDVQAARERATQGSSLGLLGMEERASLVGGSMKIISAPGKGTEIQVIFPACI